MLKHIEKLNISWYKLSAGKMDHGNDYLRQNCFRTQSLSAIWLLISYESHGVERTLMYSGCFDRAAFTEHDIQVNDFLIAAQSSPRFQANV